MHACGDGREPLLRVCEHGEEPVGGAAAYQLVVIGPGLPIWAWTGLATEVVLGGSLGETAFDGPAIIDGSCWSVVARDDSGAALAVSDLIPTMLADLEPL